MADTAKVYILNTPERARVVAERIGALDTTQAWEVRLSRHRHIRTLSQNRRYWLLLQKASTETGNDPQTLHEFCKLEFLEPIAVNIGGREHLVPRSTAGLDTVEFSEYVDRVEAFLAGQGVWLD